MSLSPYPYPYARSVFLGYPFPVETGAILHKIAITLRILNLHMRSAFEPEFGDSLPKRILRPYNQSQFSIHWLNANEKKDFSGDVSKIEWLKYHLTVNPTTKSCSGFDCTAKNGALHILCHDKESNQEPWYHIIENEDEKIIEGLLSWFSTKSLTEETLRNPEDWDPIIQQTTESCKSCRQKEDLDRILKTGWNDYIEHLNNIMNN